MEMLKSLMEKKLSQEDEQAWKNYVQLLSVREQNGSYCTNQLH